MFFFPIYIPVLSQTHFVTQENLLIWLRLLRIRKACDVKQLCMFFFFVSGLAKAFLEKAFMLFFLKEKRTVHCDRGVH